MSILITMLFMGMILGFAGTGGSGFIIALLVTVFHIPIHTALGTSIAAMIFTTLSGSISHFKEGNALLRTGIWIGLFGSVGAYGGTFVARLIDANQLIWMTGGMLLLSGFLIWLRTRIHVSAGSDLTFHEQSIVNKPTFWPYAGLTGIGTGALSGIFGIGSTPFIQLALLILFKLPLRQTVGTTMLVILPIAICGSAGFYQAGYFDGVLLLQVVTGTMTGSYIGAKFTKSAPRLLLRTALVITPITGGLLLLFR